MTHNVLDNPDTEQLLILYHNLSVTHGY